MDENKLIFAALRATPPSGPVDIQALHDAFYHENGPCCAGCDHWSWLNSRIGECRKAAPVSGADRTAGLWVIGCSLPIGAGHPFTARDHKCGDFLDTYDWVASGGGA